MSLFASWWLSVLLDACIATAFAGIAYTAFSGLLRTRQLQTNALGAATGAMFACCAVGHAAHGLHMLLPDAGVDIPAGLAMRAAIAWPFNAIDIVTAGIAIWYWTLRPKFAALLDGGLLFSYLQKRFDNQSRTL
ncbi:MAG: hypothetical protein PVSMB8_09210 [Vulcanimicrobiaceae bacterium]